MPSIAVYTDYRRIKTFYWTVGNVSSKKGVARNIVTIALKSTIFYGEIVIHPK
jgi:hypothetical protein